MAEDTTITPTLQAAAYANAEMRVFPVRWNPGGEGHKAPMPGYAWRQRASCDVSEVAQDFTEAELLWGIDNVCIAWASGEDGYVVVDVDRKEIPPWTQAFDFAAGLNETGKGWHFVLKFPVDFEPGNSTTNLPDHNGVDVRGKGGYIIIDAPDRPGFALAELHKARPFPRPDWLVPFAGQVDHASKAEIHSFAEQHQERRQMGSLDGIRAMLASFDERRAGGVDESRHNMALGMATQVAIEAGRGYYPFIEGLTIVHDWWKATLRADPTRPVQRHEWGEMVSWAVGRAQQVLGPPTAASDDDEPPEPLNNGITGIRPLDWRDAWSADPNLREWLVRDLLPLGRSCSLTADAKAGKSELVLYLVACLAQGIDPWSRQPREPVKVAYFDFEMTLEDVIERMRAFGYDGSEDWSNLDYYLLPPMQALDTRAGAGQFTECLDYSQPSMVVIDTLMRTLDGDENDAATFAAFYSLVGMTIKRRQITMLRLDHFGKDKSKGTRGSTAKDADVDVIWAMRVSGRYSRKLTSRSRVAWVPEVFHLERYANPHVNFAPRDQVIENIPSQGAHELIAVLDLLDIPLTFGRDKVRDRLIPAGYTAGNDELAEAIRLRKERGPLPVVVTDRSTDDDPVDN